MLDLHVHLLGHLDRKATRENIQSYLDQAVRMKINQIGFADHDYYWDELDLDLIREVSREYPGLEVRIGLELEYREGQEERIWQLIESYPFDYVIGSVHEIEGWAFDFSSEQDRHYAQDSDNLYKNYFKAIEKAACSGLFSIIGHFDLIKIFGVRPHTDVRILAANALEAVKDNGLVLELNTNGRYKPVREFYPETKIIEMAKEMGIPFTLGSDAHEAGNVGRDIREACALLKSLGVKELMGFTNGRKQLFRINN